TAGGAAVAGEPAGAAASLADWIRLLRPRQWVKNTFVLAPLLFSGLVREPASVAAALAAFFLFSLLASGVYCWNDVVDSAADRAHPVKRERPVAAGRIRPGQALVAGTALTLAAVAGGFAVAPRLGLVLAAYLVLNIGYTRWLKAMVLLDVFAIAAFFVLRLLAGVAAIDVTPSVWLLLCGGLLSLYLGFAKRRHELLLMGDGSSDHRSVLAHYSAPLLDQMSGILLSVTVVSYIMYTLTSETAQQAGSEALSYSAVFVLYGVFRYLYLTHQSRGGDPTETLLTDRSLLVAVGLWLAYCAWILYRPL
ncbi:MAG TPA: decaprenyl-phosphate phosphoribosyltransferase, partial [Methylomirabilota bacterium]